MKIHLFSRLQDAYLSFESNISNLPEHVVSQLGEEWLFNKVLVVFLQKFLGCLLGLHGTQLVSLGLESADDVSDDTTLKEKKIPSDSATL